MNYQFIQHNAFASRWKRRAGDEELQELLMLLQAAPDAGDPIPGCGMLRKLRLADPSRGKGKRGGLRVIYTHSKEAKRVRLLAVYGKDEQDDLSRDDLKLWCEIAGRLRKADLDWARRQSEDQRRK